MQIQKTKVSIGVPIYNEENTLNKTLNSIINSAKQLPNPYEVIICFNGTTDRSKKIAEKFKYLYFPDLKIIESEKSKTKALVNIIKKCEGDYLIMCDGDVIVKPDSFLNLLNSFTDPKIIAVTGCPTPYPLKGKLYNILNARMLYPKSEIAKNSIKGKTDKPFIHGRIYALKKEFFSDELILKKLSKSIGDDTFLSHFILKKYGRDSLNKEYSAIVRYLPVQSLKSWWHKWSRIWYDLERLYKDNPDFSNLKVLMQTKINWKFVFSHKVPIPFYFIIERGIHYIGKFYFKLTKDKNRHWIRLEDTKKVIS